MKGKGLALSVDLFIITRQDSESEGSVMKI